jgi:type II secretory pathway component PulM
MISKLKLIRDQIAERWEDLLESTRTWWSSLAPRERVILGSASGLFAAVLLVFLTKSVFGIINETSARAESLAENGRKIQSLIQEIVETRMLSSRYDNLIASGQIEGSLKSYLDSQAARYGVIIAEAKPSTVNSNQATEGGEILEVRLGPDTSLSSGLNFLEAVQNRLGVRILHLRVIPSPADRQKLSIDALIAKQATEQATPVKESE